VTPLRTLAILCAAIAGSAGAAFAQPGAAIGGAAGRASSVQVHGPYAPYWYGAPAPYWYGAYAPYGYGAYAPWGPCAAGLCGDGTWLRSAIRRELQQQELRRELELRAGGGVPPGGGSPYGAQRPPPPPTPESQLQPAYRGSGEVRPEYRDAGRPR